jgi:hypothetical protein
MKIGNMKIYITAVLMIFTVCGNAQIGQKVETKKSVLVGKVAPLGSFKEELSYVETDNGPLYTLAYNDMKFTAITNTKSISFYASNSEVETLYGDMKNQFEKEVGNSYDLKLGEADVRVERSKYLGVPILTIYVIKNGVQSFFYLTKKETDKLFGK